MIWAFMCCICLPVRCTNSFLLNLLVSGHAGNHPQSEPQKSNVLKQLCCGACWENLSVQAKRIKEEFPDSKCTPLTVLHFQTTLFQGFISGGPSFRLLLDCTQLRKRGLPCPLWVLQCDVCRDRGVPWQRLLVSAGVLLT